MTIDVKRIGIPSNVGESFLEYAQPKDRTMARMYQALERRPVTENEKRRHDGEVLRSVGVFQWENEK